MTIGYRQGAAAILGDFIWNNASQAYSQNVRSRYAGFWTEVCCVSSLILQYPKFFPEGFTGIKGAMSICDLFQESLRRDFGNPWPHIFLGGYEGLFGPEGGYQRYETAAELDPNSVGNVELLGYYYFSGQEHEAAFHTLDAAKRLRPLGIDFMYLLADAAFQTQRYDAAYGTYMEIKNIDLRPSHQTLILEWLGKIDAIRNGQ
jgi:tetratricopeptide (TPR) repeat protein